MEPKTYNLEFRTRDGQEELGSGYDAESTSNQKALTEGWKLSLVLTELDCLQTERQAVVGYVGYQLSVIGKLITDN